MTAIDRRNFPINLLCCAVALALTSLRATAVTLPTAGKVLSGNVTFGQSGNQLDVIQTSSNAIVNWQSFSVGAGDRVVFSQPTSQSVILNRVVGTDPSSVMGRIDANGRVFIVNPNGVLFGTSSNVNVGGLVASTLDIADADFKAGKYAFSRGGASPASVRNDGSLRAIDGGSIFLVGADVTNTGLVEANGGSVGLGAGKSVAIDLQGDGLTQLRVTEGEARAMQAAGVTGQDAPAYVVNQQGVVRARSASLRDGVVVLDGGSGDVLVSGVIDVSGGAGNSGGQVGIHGRDVGLFGQGKIDASGAAGGMVRLRADAGADGGGMIAVAAAASVDASATTVGNGGGIDFTASGARVSGGLVARGGTLAGDGGLIKFNVSGGVDTRGIRADASAPHGKAGTFNIDPFEVTIEDGTSAPPPPNLDPFVPIADSVILTGDIDAALNAGTNVTITNGTGGTTFGAITFGSVSGPSVNITRTSGTAPVTLRFDSGQDISTKSSTTISSTAGPLNVEMNANSAGIVGGGKIDLSDATILTNGGSVKLFGAGDAAQPASGQVFGARLRNSVIDTRVGQSDAQVGGAVSMVALGMNDSDSPDTVGVRLDGSSIRTSTGSITLNGKALSSIGSDGLPAPLTATGVRIVDSTLSTTSGGIHIVGVGSRNVNAIHLDLFGVRIDGASTVQTGSGDVDIAGLMQTSVPAAERTVGLQIGAGSTIQAGTGAPLLLSGSANGADPGIQIDGTISASDRNVILRGSSPNAPVALGIAGQVLTTGIVGIRPADIDVEGVVADRNDISMSVGGSQGFGVTPASLGNIHAGTIVLGSDQYAAALSVDAPLILGAGATNLTLQTGAGGSIALNQPVDVGANTLALVSGGNVDESGAAGVTAGALLVRAGGTTGATLNGTNLVATFAADTGTAALSISAGATLDIGSVAATGIAPAGNAVGAVGTSGIVTGFGQVKVFDGDLGVSAPINADYIDLVATAGTLQAAPGSSINAPTWHVYAQTWVGETRGGLAGNGALPNLYGCVFADSCQVNVLSNAHTFVYAQQPTLQVSVDNLTRSYGDANPVFTLTGQGLVNGDTVGNIVNGSLTTGATATSGVGTYAVSGGSLTTTSGYQLVVTDGSLTVAPRQLTVSADGASRVYGSANAAFTGTVTGLASFDSPTALSVSYGSSATASSNVGSYAISPTVASSPILANYAVTTVDGTLAVTPANLVISAGSGSRLYGTTNPTFTGTVTGLAPVDSLAALGVSFGAAAAPSSNVGNYAVTPAVANTAMLSNYTVTTHDGALAVTPASLVITAAPGARVYGDANPVFTGSVTGLAAFDTPAALGLSFTSSATPASNVGSYAITSTTSNVTLAANYAIVRQDSTLTVTPATLVMSATPATREFLRDGPALTGTVSGFRNGDTIASSTTGSPTWTSAATAKSPIGVYAVTGGGLAAGNYVFVQDPANATALNIVAQGGATVAEAQSTRDRGLGSIAPWREDLSTYLYDRNLGAVAVCNADSELDARVQQSSHDLLAIEWSRVRARPNVTNCFDSARKNGCDAF